LTSTFKPFFLASEDWGIGGKGSVMLCTKCRIKFKKYGVNAQLEIDLDNQTPSDVSSKINRYS